MSIGWFEFIIAGLVLGLAVTDYWLTGRSLRNDETSSGDTERCGDDADR